VKIMETRLKPYSPRREDAPLSGEFEIEKPEARKPKTRKPKP